MGLYALEGLNTWLSEEEDVEDEPDRQPEDRGEPDSWDTATSSSAVMTSRKRLGCIVSDRRLMSGLEVKSEP